MLDSVVMIPQEARALAVGVVVVLKLPRPSHIFGPTIPGSTLGTLRLANIVLARS
jgi:hypothetical protein